MQIRAGDSVKWVNNDEDDHTVVSDDAFNTAGNKGTNDLLPVDGSVVLRFRHPGTFVYYCRFHAQLDAFNQPVAPGPDGGIEDANGNFGTPMSGVITVLPRHSLAAQAQSATGGRKQDSARPPAPPRKARFLKPPGLSLGVPAGRFLRADPHPRLLLFMRRSGP